MSELKPCSFCGCSAKIAQCDDEGNVRGEEYESNPWSGLGYRIVHESDDCPISTGEDGYNLIYDSREEAENHWNRRAYECDRDELIKVADVIEMQLKTSESMLEHSKPEFVLKAWNDVISDSIKAIREACGEVK